MQLESKKRRRVIAGLFVAAGAIMVTDFSFAASWTVGYTAGTNAGEAQSAAAPSNLTITAVATPSPTNLLAPGGTGDVVMQITNPNPYAITVSAITLPQNTIGAVGYTDAGLTTPNLNCTALVSNVNWTGASTTTTVNHALTTPVVVPANSSQTVTLTNDVTMGSGAPVGCASTYFAMPALAGVTANVGGTGSGPSTDS